MRNPIITITFDSIQLHFCNAFQALAGNCLKANPKIIDGIFNPVGLPYDDVKFNEDFSGMIELFSTRFKRPHVFTIESVGKVRSLASFLMNT